MVDIMVPLSASGATTGMRPTPVHLMDTMDPRGLTVASSLVQVLGSVEGMVIVAMAIVPVIAEATDGAMLAAVARDSLVVVVDSLAAASTVTRELAEVVVS